MYKHATFKMIFSVSILIVLLVTLLGCFDMITDSSTTYTENPTNIRYTITYGYTIQPSGSGKYDINYPCEIPSVLEGSVEYNVLHAQDYELGELAHNSIVRWNISAETTDHYRLGITATVDATSYIIQDLSGTASASLAEIQQMDPEIYTQYCREQSNGTFVLITPRDEDVSIVANRVLRESDTNNSFLVGKALFVWLKEHTTYQVHTTDGSVQSAPVTLSKKTGDCDDLSFLYISLCRSVGVPARFVRGYLLSENTSGDMMATAHAWAEIFVGDSLGNNGWIPVECAALSTETTADVHQNFGLENAFHLRLFVDDGSNTSMQQSMSGISYKIYGQDREITVESFAEIASYTDVLEQKLVVTKDNQRSYE
jgi:transglutaminase-like putative cysteine protease